MSVFERDALEASPLADLHEIASELSIDGYRRLRKAVLIDAIIERGGGDGAADAAESDVVDGDGGAVAEEPAGVAEEPTSETRSRRRGRRGGRGRAGGREDEERAEAPAAEADAKTERKPASKSRREDERTNADRAGTGGRDGDGDGELAEGTVELVAGGSGFLRVVVGEQSDDDVYISAAQVKRCELVNGDRVSGPRRSARRSERYASLIRIDTINGQPATEVVDGGRYDDLPAAFPSVRLSLGSEDPTLTAIESLTPFGRGSRVTIIGGARSGKSELLRALADVFAASSDESVQLLIALVGVRPEEITEWNGRTPAPAAALSFAASTDALDQALELVVDQAKRIAARGGHVIVLVDTLDAVHEHTARKALAAARQIVDGGSLTLIATAARTIGGETTVIALDAARAGGPGRSALDLAASGTIRPELLVGEEGAAAILSQREQANG